MCDEFKNGNVCVNEISLDERNTQKMRGNVKNSQKIKENMKYPKYHKK